jgi:uncharacterized protein
LANKFWDEIKDRTEIKLKSFFYMTRSLLACNWIIKNKSVLPMHMEGLMELIDSEYREQLRVLIQLKSSVGEKYLHPQDSALNKQIKKLFGFIEGNKENLGETQGNFSLLNDFFLKKLNDNAYNRTDQK